MATMKSFHGYEIEDEVARTTKQDKLNFNTAYDPETNKVATMSDLQSAIQTLSDRIAALEPVEGYKNLTIKSNS